jgi:predicted enzyme related to lactoylglutathione lyase
MADQANSVGWFEIPVRDIARAKAFYEHALGVSLEPMQMGPGAMEVFPYTPKAAGAAGALVQSDGYTPSHAGSVVYFTVASIEEALGRVHAKGGKTLVPKMGIGEHGFIAHFEDTEGNRVAFHAMQ